MIQFHTWSADFSCFIDEYLCVHVLCGSVVIGTKIVSVNQVLIIIRTNTVVKIKQNAISDSLQRLVPMTPLSSEYFSNSFLSVNGLMGQFCQSL